MNRVISILLSGFLGGVFIYAGILKILDPGTFYHDIVRYHLLDDDSSWRLAHYLPWLEVLAGVGVLCRFSRPSSSLILAILLLLFIEAVNSAWSRGLSIECGCFGRLSGGVSYSWALIRDLVLLLAAVYLATSGFYKNLRHEL